MPELPEVETTRRGIAPILTGHRIIAVVVREPRLRQLVAPDLEDELRGRAIDGVRRRGKYLLLASGSGAILIHLGMSGSLRLVATDTPPGRHDHLDIVFDHDLALRLTDPRRFGLVVWVPDCPGSYPLLAGLGPEPLDPSWNGAALARAARGRRTAIKALIMDARIVVGVGNIYANEALFMAGIHPARPAGRISRRRLDALAEAIKQVLERAIEAGGTSLRDFVAEDGRPGYFAQSLQVYGREGQPCPRCGGAIRRIRQFGRSTFYCPRCQR